MMLEKSKFDQSHPLYFGRRSIIFKSMWNALKLNSMVHLSCPRSSGFIGPGRKWRIIREALPASN